MIKLLSIISTALFFSLVGQTVLAGISEIAWTLLEAVERGPHSRPAALEVVKEEVKADIDLLLRRTLCEGSICSRTPGQVFSYVMPVFREDKMFSSFPPKITINPFTLTKVSEKPIDRIYPYPLQVLLHFTRPEGERSNSFNGTLTLNLADGVLGKTVHIAAETTLRFSNDSLNLSFFENLVWLVDQVPEHLLVKAEFLTEHPPWFRELVDKFLAQEKQVEDLTLRLQEQGRRARVGSGQLQNMPLGIARPVQIIKSAETGNTTSSVATTSSTSSVAETRSTTTPPKERRVSLMEQALLNIGNGISFMGNNATDFKG